MDNPDPMPERKPDPGEDDQPEVYGVDKDRSGWKFSRRDFLTLAAAAAGAMVAGSGPGRKALAGPIELVGHATEPPLSELSPGKPFTTVWQFRNGTGQPWGEGALLRLSAADRFQAARSVALPNAAPGQIVTVQVPMVAPAELAGPPVEAAFQLAEAEYKTFLPIVRRSDSTCSCVGDVCTCVGDVCTCVGYSPCACVGDCPCVGYFDCACVGDVCTCVGDFCVCVYDIPLP